MTHPDHNDEAVAQRIAWLRDRYPVGTIVQREDGCLVLLRHHEPPTAGGYIYGFGERIDRRDGHLDGRCATGMLTKCAVVRADHNGPRPTVNW